MAVGFPAGISKDYIVNNAQAKLAALRRAFADCEDFYQWLSAYGPADLEADPIGMDAISAQAIFNAFADAHGEYVARTGGTPNAAIPYNFAASQRVVIGPLT